MSGRLLLRAVGPSALGPLAKLVHDCCFELDRLHHEPAEGRVTLPLGCPRADQFSYRPHELAARPTLLLEFREVAGLAIEQSEVGAYSVVDILGSEHEVVIEADIDLVLRLTVGRVEARLWSLGSPRT